jgi:DNA-3-methyladenine glycosylase II
VAHLIATDARLEPLIRRHPCPLFSPEGLAEEIDPFRSLVSSIIGQQVSGAAARSIKDKFVALFNRENDGQDPAKPRRFPTPEEVAQCDLATLRTAGLSQRKAEYIHGLSQKFATGELSARMLLNASDEELMEKLTAVRGLGRWSVEMFACFALKRIDVFSTGDLGVQ